MDEQLIKTAPASRAADRTVERTGSQETKKLEETLRASILKRVEAAGQMDDKVLAQLIDEQIAEAARFCFLPLQERIRLRTALFNGFRRLDALQELIDDPKITEIMINGPKQIFVEREGKISLWKKQFETEEKLEDIIQQIVSRINRSVNTASPIADARLPDGSRVHIVLPPVALNGPILTIRKFSERMDMEHMIANRTISRQAADYLKVLVAAGYNLFISGGTSSGKSTFLNALSDYIPQDERVITIEDAAELNIRHIANLVRLETRNANTEGSGEISMSALIKASLRMRPDRIIVGEVRGGEAADMLAAMNTGHDGSLSTGHGNSTGDMLNRLESMVLMGAELPLAAIQAQIASAIDVIIHLGRLPDKSRKILEISELGAYSHGKPELRTLFQYQPETRQLERKGSLARLEKLRLKGLRLPE